MGILNAHAGDLPRYRGNAVPNWAILNDEADIALTVHVMADALDAGAVLLKRRLTLTQDTYIGDVYNFIETNLPDMFIEALNGMAAGTLTAIPQSTDVALSLRCFPRVGSDSLLDWQRPATELARLVRASAEPFAGAYSFRGLEKITVWRARASRLPYPYVGTPGQVAERFLSSQEVAVLTGEGVLLLQELQTPNTGRAPATEIIRSLRDRLGIDLTQLMQLLSSGNPPLPPLS
jgi:UDP-4-amino-4-deoxy-L-arabinose formyltransferase/UDP-glucuronic acid dehydrogenase (UDP-4-keto-hexauronic acid decarboxylating)